ncbi:L-histidine N(alpha)-methyltransferase [Adhaeretor mobilis]|uniref:Histidine-specific methyltransferase EgtD n=1 Tax=Adhaeretor mobilis TaxID=1930276 RepID=A0A517N0S2_9BACT|nr:L-histidine N(alpha)-methyltransferase [Adhaeretor mobilis]QDT00733.1 Histidine-specific methyltransferase EgtD [Adhaeretor mobilis]
MIEQTLATEDFLAEATEGVARKKELLCKYFYDEKGSQLFDKIGELDEYYLTRTELGIMSTNAVESAEQLDRNVKLVEYGSGSSIKTRLLLEVLET